MAKPTKPKPKPKRLQMPKLTIPEAAPVVVWLDYCIENYRRQLAVWRRIYRTSKLPGSKQSVAYYTAGIKAFEWARSHVQQAALWQHKTTDDNRTLLQLGKRLAELREADRSARDRAGKGKGKQKPTRRPNNSLRLAAADDTTPHTAA